MEHAEEKLGASGAHTSVEFWIVYVLPKKTEDPRVPGKQNSFACNNKEVALCSLPSFQRGSKVAPKVVHRWEFNSCGELSTAATTYTGVKMRRFCELPRMNLSTKSSILGTAAASGARQKRIEKHIDEQGQPFSFCDVKPLTPVHA